ncbi:MAG: HepT-like ribonuclease domain-containing protein [Pseudonocardiaceae bacterium]
MSEPDELLGFALEALDEIDTLVGHGRQEFADSLDRQRALAFCWIAVGSALKDYTRISQLPARQEPLSSPIRFRDRLAHQALSQLDAELLWRVSTERVRQLRVILLSLRTSGR